MVHKITDINFTETIRKNACLIVVYFYAEHCGPCKSSAPIIESLSEIPEFKERILFLSIDNDKNEQVPTTLGVEYTPTVLFIRNNKIIDKKVGYKEGEYRAQIAKLLHKYI